MRTNWSRVLRWLPAIAWMLVLYAASSDTDSAARSSRVLGPLVQWLFPEISEQALGAVLFAGRKAAHLTVYAVLAILLGTAMGEGRRRVRPARFTAGLGRVLPLVILYALFDEFHQTFVPGRQGSLLDVGLDTLGGLAGWWVLQGIRRWRERTRGPGPGPSPSGNPAAPGPTRSPRHSPTRE